MHDPLLQTILHHLLSFGGFPGPRTGFEDEQRPLLTTGRGAGVNAHHLPPPIPMLSSPMAQSSRDEDVSIVPLLRVPSTVHVDF